MAFLSVLIRCCYIGLLILAIQWQGTNIPSLYMYCIMHIIIILAPRFPLYPAVVCIATLYVRSYTVYVQIAVAT